MLCARTGACVQIRLLLKGGPGGHDKHIGAVHGQFGTQHIG